jgi:hypothetical protein
MTDKLREELLSGISDKDYENSKEMRAYKYLVENAYRFSPNIEFAKDLIHYCMLDILINKEKFAKVKYIRSWCFKQLQGNVKKVNRDFDKQKLSVLDIYAYWNNIDSNFISNPDLSRLVDGNTIFQQVLNKQFEGKSNNKGKSHNIFLEWLKGFTPLEISKKLNMSKNSVNVNLTNYKKRIIKAYE